jgi:hypothetical protein
MNYGRRREPGPGEHLLDGGQADPMQGCVRDPQLCPAIWIAKGHGGQDRGQVRLGHLVAQELPRAAQGQVAQGPRGRGGRRDAGVDGRHDLRAVGPVHLDPVVVPGVVAGGDHHPGHRVLVPDGEGQHGCGHRAGQPEHPPPGAGQHGRGLVGELP